jgi:hypothetical protein
VKGDRGLSESDMQRSYSELQHKDDITALAPFPLRPGPADHVQGRLVRRVPGQSTPLPAPWSARLASSTKPLARSVGLVIVAEVGVSRHDVAAVRKVRPRATMLGVRTRSLKRPSSSTGRSARNMNDPAPDASSRQCRGTRQPTLPHKQLRISNLAGVFVDHQAGR